MLEVLGLKPMEIYDLLKWIKKKGSLRDACKMNAWNNVLGIKQSKIFMVVYEVVM